MNMQPEATTYPLATGWEDQVRAVTKLRKLFPTFRILIKDHPRQFSYEFRNKDYRSKRIYDQLQSIHNTFFLPIDVDLDPIIAEANIFSFINGTSLFDSVLSGKPAISFTSQLFDNFYNLLNLGDADFDPESALEWYEKCNTISQESLDIHLANFFSLLKRIAVHSGFYSRYVHLFINSDMRNASLNIISCLNEVDESCD